MSRYANAADEASCDMQALDEEHRQMRFDYIYAELRLPLDVWNEEAFAVVLDGSDRQLTYIYSIVANHANDEAEIGRLIKEHVEQRILEVIDNE